MYRCPKCDRILKFNMKYSCGYPCIYYTCVCGYNSANNHYVASTTTQLIEHISLIEKDQVEQYGYIW